MSGSLAINILVCSAAFVKTPLLPASLLLAPSTALPGPSPLHLLFTFLSFSCHQNPLISAFPFLSLRRQYKENRFKALCTCQCASSPLHSILPPPPSAPQGIPSLLLPVIFNRYPHSCLAALLLHLCAVLTTEEWRGNEGTTALQVGLYLPKSPSSSESYILSEGRRPRSNNQ